MLTLQPLTPADLGFVTQAEQHSEHRRFVGQWTTDQYLNALEDPNYQCFLLVADGQPVGHCILADLQSPDDSVLLKRILVYDKGLGYGRLALDNILVYAFGVIKANRVWLDVRSFNDRAEKLYQSIGFRYEGTLKKASKVDDAYVDLNLYAILREEFHKKLNEMETHERI